MSRHYKVDVKLNTRVCGIPCIAAAREYWPGDPGNISGPPDRCYPPEPAEVDWVLLDSRGRPAPWLVDKMTVQDEEAIEAALIEAIEEEHHD